MGWGPWEGPARPSTAVPTALRRSWEHGVLHATNWKSNTTRLPARLSPAQAPTRPGTSGIYDGSPLLETLGPGQACSSEQAGCGREEGRARGALGGLCLCLTEKRRDGSPEATVGGMGERAGPRAPPAAPHRPSSPGAHRCFFSSEWAQAASPAHAWHHGPRGLSGWSPKAPRPLQVETGDSDQPPTPGHTGSVQPHVPPQTGRGASAPTRGASRCAQDETPNCQQCPTHPRTADTRSPTHVAPAARHHEAEGEAEATAAAAGQWGRGCSQPGPRLLLKEAQVQAEPGREDPRPALPAQETRANRPAAPSWTGDLGQRAGPRTSRGCCRDSCTARVSLPHRPHLNQPSMSILAFEGRRKQGQTGPQPDPTSP